MAQDRLHVGRARARSRATRRRSPARTTAPSRTRRAAGPRTPRASTRRPSGPSTLATSCGSVTTAVVPCGTTARANSAGMSLEDSMCTCASMNPGTRYWPLASTRVAAVVLAQAGDHAAGHRHVGLEPLAREHREHPRTADDEVGRRVAARDGDQVGPHDASPSAPRGGRRSGARRASSAAAHVARAWRAPAARLPRQQRLARPALVRDARTRPRPRARPPRRPRRARRS